MESGDYSAETIEALLKQVQGLSPRMGSCCLTKDTHVANTWWNFIYTPHRTGFGGDNPEYGTLLLFPMVGAGSSYIVRADKNELVSRMVKMQQVGADLPKVAVMPHDSTDVLTLLSATIEMKNKYFVTPVITISMGKLGVASRLCGEVFGSAMTFASAGDSSAPGQISIDVVNAVLDSITE